MLGRFFDFFGKGASSPASSDPLLLASIRWQQFLASETEHSGALQFPPAEPRDDGAEEVL